MKSTSTPPLPVLTCTNVSKFVAPAFLTNGFLGLRPGPIPLVSNPYAGAASPPGPYDGHTPTVSATVAGFLHTDPGGKQPILAPAPFLFETDVVVDGKRMHEHLDQVMVHKQTLDMSNAELSTALSFVGSGWHVTINVTQFVSRSAPTIAAMRLELGAQPASLNVTVHPLLNGSSSPGVPYNSTTPLPSWTWDARVHTLALAADGGFRLGIVAVGSQQCGDMLGRSTYELVVSAQSDTYSAPADPLLAAYLTLEAALYQGGFGALRQANRAAWADVWLGRPLFSGDGFTAADQRSLDGAHFYLHSAAHAASRTGVPPYGLSQPGRCYQGGIMWDMDSWMVQPVSRTAAGAAVGLARFRTRTLDVAQRRAAVNGYLGLNGRAAAYYPITVAMTEGQSASPCVEMWAEQHQTLDVAIGVWEAAAAADDPHFMRHEAWPVLRSVAEWIGARGVWSARGFEIHGVEGPDESVGRVDNSNYVNLASMIALQAALACHATLPAAEQDPVAAAEWRAILESFYLPLDPSGEIVLPFDGADVTNATLTPPASWSVGNLAFLLAHGLPARVTEPMLRATYAFEEALRNKAAYGPSSIPCKGSPYFTCAPVAALAARFGDRAKAARLLRLLAQNYTHPPFDIVSEYSARQGYFYGARPLHRVCPTRLHWARWTHLLASVRPAGSPELVLLCTEVE